LKTNLSTILIKGGILNEGKSLNMELNEAVFENKNEVDNLDLVQFNFYQMYIDI